MTVKLLNLSAALLMGLLSLWPASSAFGQTGNKIPPTGLVLQILHTNDLHSFWHSSANKQLGGYARIKHLLDERAAYAQSQGWTSIRLDAGDFSEGSVTFLAEKGAHSFRIMQAMKFDAVTLGNHDYLTGLADLEYRSTQTDQRLPLIAANFVSDKPAGVFPGRVLYRGGLKIAVAGATIQNIIYNWAVRPAEITDPATAVDTWLSSQNADINIALTHLGYKRELDFIRSTVHPQLVVGGHSHDALTTPVFMFNKNKKTIPLFQAGARGAFVGEIIVKVFPGQPLQLLSSVLHEINRSIPEDSEVKDLVAKGTAALSQDIGADLYKVIAQSDDDYFTHREANPILGNFLADSVREMAATDISMDSGLLYGDRLSKGPVTYMDILSLTPHVYDWGAHGWKIYVCELSVARLKDAISILSWFKTPLSVSGMEFTITPYHRVKDLLIHGQPPTSGSQRLTLAMSEGFVKGLSSYPQVQAILCNPILPTTTLVRDAAMQKALKIGVFNKQTLGPQRIHGYTFKPDINCPHCPIDFGHDW